jgi:D-arabinose 1-dehydrogenase-like Zn-dependent alcohol dehydrogenase
MEYFSRGDIHPLPTHEFTAANIEQAFRYMQKGTHIGKIVIVMPDSEADIPWSPLLKQPIFRVDGCHIIIGGLGGLGRSVSSWMVHHGARHVVFLSRSAGKTTNHDTFIRELRAQNCRVDLVSGDICNAEDINLMIKRLDTKVVGIMQASMVLKVRNLQYALAITKPIASQID